MTRVGLPHSEILGSKDVCSSPRLIAAYHVLHRLLAPRHPPYALYNLTKKHGKDASSTSVLLSCQRANPRQGEAAEALLSQTPRPEKSLVEITGLEPVTSCVQSRRSPS